MLKKRFLFIPLAFVISLLLIACNAQTKIYKVGAICYHTTLASSFEGFKARMAELGYVEGKNITYIYNGPMADAKSGEREIKNFLAQDVDLILTMGTQATLQAKQAIEGTDIVVVFAPVLNPVEEGVVESINHPGGNLTGVQMGNTLPKSLEWLLKLAPGTRKFYVPHNPKDEVSATAITPLREAASVLGVELMLGEVETPEEAAAGIKALSKDEAVFLIPSPTIQTRINDVIQAATEHGIATGAYMSGHVEAGALISYTSDFFSMGKQAAQLTNLIFRGTAPANLPVETSEYFLNINLKTASALGLNIPDDILKQASTVIR